MVGAIFFQIICGEKRDTELLKQDKTGSELTLTDGE